VTTTALQVCASAYRQANVDQTLTSLSNTQEFPYNIALDLLNKAILELNRMGNFWFCETSVTLPYSSGVSSYNLNTLATPVVEPKRITRLRAENLTVGAAGELTEVNYRNFEYAYRTQTVPTQQPTAWAKYNGTLYLNAIPDQDYGLTLYYYQDLPSASNVDGSDIMIVPDAHIDILQDGVYAYLLSRMGRPDFQNAYSLWQAKAHKLVSLINKDAGLPTQMPAAF
jgi:hypothetical protein